VGGVFVDEGIMWGVWGDVVWEMVLLPILLTVLWGPWEKSSYCFDGGLESKTFFSWQISGERVHSRIG